MALVDAEENSEQWSEAFSVIPNQGYQDGKFTVSVSDPSKLDYEIEAWRNITLKVNCHWFYLKYLKQATCINFKITNFYAILIAKLITIGLDKGKNPQKILLDRKN